MADKTPPLVIPLTIDTTGVDRGVSRANSRLNQIGGGAAGTQSGFGSGGAGALSVGAAAAIGGAFGSRGSFERMKAQSTWTKTRGHSGFLDRMRPLGGAAGGAGQVRALFQESRDWQAGDDPINPIKRRNRMAAQVDAVFAERRKLQASRGMVGLANRYEAFKASMPKPSLEGVRGGLKGLPESGIGAAVGGIGALSAISKMVQYAATFKQNRAAQFNDLDRFKGTEYYGLARQMRKDYTGRGEGITPTDRFFLGGRKAAPPGTMGGFEAYMNLAGAAVHGAVEYIGSGLNYVPPFNMFMGAKRAAL